MLKIFRKGFLLLLGLLLLVSREKNPARWLLFLMAGVLALRYVRNVGLFFMLVPLALGPALARIEAFGRNQVEGRERLLRRGVQTAGALIPPLLALWFIVQPFPAFGFRLSPDYYPVKACDFMEQEQLFAAPIYNEVRFGGYLVDRYRGQVKIFMDDRNEIFEPLLREYHEIRASSKPSALKAIPVGRLNAYLESLFPALRPGLAITILRRPARENSMTEWPLTSTSQTSPSASTLMPWAETWLGSLNAWMKRPCLSTSMTGCGPRL